MKDGGPAFPSIYEYQHGGGTGQEHLPGMTLRDWFAGMALQGYAANASTYDKSHDQMAAYAYQYADAMLAQRKKEQS